MRLLQGPFFCICYSSMYVLAMYLIPYDIRKLPRHDHKQVQCIPLSQLLLLFITSIKIYYRLWLSILVTAVLIIFSYTLHLNLWNFHPNISFIELLGFKTKSLLTSITTTILLMCIFYLGPIVTWLCYLHMMIHYHITAEALLVRLPTPRSLYTVLLTEYKSVRRMYSPLTLIRNLIIAPITEELVFRCLMVPTLYATYTAITPTYSIYNILITGPIYFSIAHIHHAYEKYRQGSALSHIIIETIIQFIYTYIFGFISIVLFTRTGHMISCLISHIICNFIGLPNISFMTPPNKVYIQEYAYLYKYRYYLLFLHGFGLILFFYLLFPYTHMLALDSIYWRQLLLSSLSSTTSSTTYNYTAYNPHIDL